MDNEQENSLQSFMEESRAMAAQCWEDEETSGIAIDSRLVEAVARRIAFWMDVGAQHARNEDFYRGLVDQCAEHLGVRAHTADDGTVMEDPLRLRIPELVAQLAKPHSDSPVVALGGSVIPQVVSEDGTDETPVVEVTVVTAMSGGADEVQGMPRTLTLLRQRASGPEYRQAYVQDPERRDTPESQ